MRAEPEPRDVIDGLRGRLQPLPRRHRRRRRAGYCAGEPWVRPIDEYDLAAYYKSLSWRASVDPLLGYIAVGHPTGEPRDEPRTRATSTRGQPAHPTPLSSGERSRRSSPTPTELASNAWAIGPDRTADGTTMLVGNPHFPWQGALRFYEAHLTVPDELDVYGVSLLGSPAINIGFTEGVAWSATVSAGRRFTAYTLDLVPGDPTRYRYGDDERAMTSRTVSVDVLAADGTTSTVERTFWFSHYGPIIDFPGLGWTDAQTLTFRDANADNDELISQFMAMNQARSMDDMIDAHATWQGIPWVNTIAASADGRIWYADTSATPNLSDAAIAAWRTNVAADPITKVALDNGVILLDGSDPLYEWVDDPGARDPGLVPFDEMPQLERTDFVFNANDSFWFVNPDELLSGYSPAHGLERTPVSNRTRMNARQLSVDGGDAGADGLFTREELRDSSVSNRVFTAEMLVDEVVAECNAYAALVRDPNGIWQPACDTLAAWDRRVDVDSVGAALWREFIESFSGSELIDAGPLWAVAFDPADPLGTPQWPQSRRRRADPDRSGSPPPTRRRLRPRLAARRAPDRRSQRRTHRRARRHRSRGRDQRRRLRRQCHDERTGCRAGRADRGLALADDARLPGEQRHELHLRRRVHRRRSGRRGVAHVRRERRSDEPVLRRPDGDVRRQAVASDPVHSGRRSPPTQRFASTRFPSSSRDVARADSIGPNSRSANEVQR